MVDTSIAFTLLDLQSQTGVPMIKCINKQGCPGEQPLFVCNQNLTYEKKVCKIFTILRLFLYDIKTKIGFGKIETIL